MYRPTPEFRAHILVDNADKDATQLLMPPPHLERT
jgi:hypothetical protein